LNDLPAGSTVTPESLQQAGLLKKGESPVKILGNGEIKVALTVRAHKYTGSAVQKIEAAGGKAEVIS
jgi:large subunit ribosomal protein L15